MITPTTNVTDNTEWTGNECIYIYTHKYDLSKLQTVPYLRWQNNEAPLYFVHLDLMYIVEGELFTIHKWLEDSSELLYQYTVFARGNLLRWQSIPTSFWALVSLHKWRGFHKYTKLQKKVSKWMKAWITISCSQDLHKFFFVAEKCIE